jgi:hypothetical protein
MTMPFSREPMGGLEEPGLVFPEQWDVVDVKEPGESEEDDDADEGPEKDAHGKGAGERDGGVAVKAEEEAAEEGKAGGEDDASDRGVQALAPGGGGDEEGGVDKGKEGEERKEEGNNAAEIEKHGASGC